MDERSAIVCCVLAIVPVIFWFLPRVLKFVWELLLTSSVSRHGFEHLHLPPGSLGYPLIGETVAFFRKGSGFYHTKLKQCGPVYKTHLLGRPTIRVVGEENVKKILLGENTIVTHNWPTSARLLLGDALTQSSGSVHKVRRKSLLYSLNSQTIDEYFPVLLKITQNMLAQSCDEKRFLAYAVSKKIAFRTAAAALVGLNETDDGLFINHYKEFSRNLMTLPFDLPGFGFRKAMRARRSMLTSIRRLLDEAKDTTRGFTPVMLRYTTNLKRMDEDAIINECEQAVDILFAGHETTSSLMTNLFMFLGQNNDVIVKLREEFREAGIIPDDTGDLTREFTLERLQRLKYVENVLKEVLRMCPPAGGGFRKVLKSFELQGYLIPKDWTIIYSIRETQHTSPMFPDSETFNPDRWDDLANSTLGCSFIPFGFGARACVGRAFAMLVLRVFTVVLVSQYDWSLLSDKIEMQYIPIPLSTDHLPVSMSRRSKQTCRS